MSLQAGHPAAYGVLPELGPPVGAFGYRSRTGEKQRTLKTIWEGQFRMPDMLNRSRTPDEPMSED